MRLLAVALLLTIASARADAPVPEEVETVTIPKAMLIELIEAYKEQKAANILLWERQEEVNKKIGEWNARTGCV